MKFDINKCIGKGLKGVLIYGLTFIVVSFAYQYPGLSQMDINELVNMLLDVKGIGTVTIGSGLMMLVNWLKNK